MNSEAFNSYCRSLAATTHVVQWGGSDVWKVGGKVFAIAAWRDDALASSFKVSELSFDILKEQPGLRPAPYLASRGLKWIQNYAAPGLGDEDLKLYLQRSYSLVLRGLSRKKRAELGLADPIGA